MLQGFKEMEDSTQSERTRGERLRRGKTKRLLECPADPIPRPSPNLN